MSSFGNAVMGALIVVAVLFGIIDTALKRGKEIERAAQARATSKAVAEAVASRDAQIKALEDARAKDASDLQAYSQQMEAFRNARARDKGVNDPVFDANWSDWLRQRSDTRGR